VRLISPITRSFMLKIEVEGSLRLSAPASTVLEVQGQETASIADGKKTF
jgi:hypothetical protein